MACYVLILWRPKPAWGTKWEKIKSVVQTDVLITWIGMMQINRVREESALSRARLISEHVPRCLGFSLLSGFNLSSEEFENSIQTATYFCVCHHNVITSISYSKMSVSIDGIHTMKLEYCHFHFHLICVWSVFVWCSCCLE